MSRNSALPGWGVNVPVHDLTHDNADHLIQTIKELRFEWIRFEFDYRNRLAMDIEQEWLSKCQAEGIKILGLLNYSVPGTLMNVVMPERKHPAVIGRLDDFSAFVTQKVTAYQTMVHHWEIWNEPNTKRFWIRQPDAAEYVNFLRAAVAQIRQLQPDATIVFGGIMGTDYTTVKPFKTGHFYKQCIQAGAARYFDAANFHPYSLDCYVSVKSYAEFLKLSLERMAQTYSYASRLSRKPVWFSEFGIATMWKRLSQQEIARLYWECYRWCAGRGVPLFVWCLHDLDHSDIEFFSPENSFGLLDSSLQPKPLYLHLKKLVDVTPS